MSYSDKCCGVCQEYQDLKPTGKFYYSSVFGETQEVFKRFVIGNVCQSCIENKLSSFSISDLELSKPKHRVDRSHGMIPYISEDGKFRKAHASRFEDTQRESKESPWLWQVHAKSSDSDVFIYTKNKRKLKRILHKLKVKGNISHLVK